MSDHTATTLQKLDELIARRSILNHAFYLAWTAGELTQDQLATYAEHYYPHVEAFPGYLEKAAAGTEDSVIRAELLDNLREERFEPRAHPEIWLSFAEGLGLNGAAVASSTPTDATAATVASFETLCSADTTSAVTALYCYESQQPEVACTKAQGLKSFYGIEDDATLEYFTVHQEADVRHREGERNAIARCLEAGATESQVLAAADQALDAYWSLLDGVCEATGIVC